MCNVLYRHADRAAQFELQVKFYPPLPRFHMKEDITRYLLSLQLRQDLLASKLPCSYLTLAILSAYIVQAELGDYEAQVHAGGPAQVERSGATLRGAQAQAQAPDIEYLKSMPLVPPALLTQEFLVRVAELHRSLGGMVPEEADLAFLDNAYKLSLYGVDFHHVRHRACACACRSCAAFL